MKKISWIFLLAFVMPLFGGCVTAYNPATGREETYVMDDKAEVKWGESMARRFLREKDILEDDKKQNYVTKIGERLAAKSRRNYLQYHFYIIDKDELNAFALPGGYIFIYKGLLDKVSEDELAFVLSHEIGHICARHAVKRYGSGLGLGVLSTASSILFPGYGATQQSAERVVNLIMLGYSRQDEYLADSLGIEGVVKAGFNPEGAVSLLERFRDMELENMVSAPVYLRTHPLPVQRIENIRKKPELATAGAYHIMAKDYLKRKDYGRAVEHYAKAIELSPYRAELFIERARIYYSLRNYKAAKKDLLEALRIEPQGAGADIAREELKIISESEAIQ